MLKDVSAALTKLANGRHFDHLADLGETYLDARAVVIVALQQRSLILGRSEGSASDTETWLQEVASAVPADFYDPLPAPSEAVRGALVDYASPDRRVVPLVIRSDEGAVLFLIFPWAHGVWPHRLTRFRDLAQRQIAGHTLLQRYRTDLRRYVEVLDHLERSAKIGTWEVDLTTKDMSWSDEVFRIHELPIGELPTFDEALQFYPEPDRTRVVEALGDIERSGTPIDMTWSFRTAAGSPRKVRVIATLERHSGCDTERLAGIIQDVTAQHEATQRLWWTANHDALTELPNRALFNDRFATALDRQSRSGRILCVVLVDVDRFKEINDTLGHAAGDQLLRQVARRLSANVRSHDTVARTGGDEFSILIEDVEDEEGLSRILSRVGRGLEIEFVWDEGTRLCTLSAGAAISPQHGNTQDELTTRADLALYQTKREPRGSLRVYEPAFGRAIRERANVLAQARQALLQGQFVPYYQPQVDVASGRIVGVEALARWVQADKVLTASEFDFVLSDHELGPLIGKSIVSRAMAEIAKLNSGRARKVALSVNASAGELMRSSFLSQIAAMQQGSARLSGPLTIEVTENVILDDPTGDLARAMADAASADVQFALDDFGASLASLVRVSTATISQIKLDRRLLSNIDNDPAAQKVLRGIVDMARELDLRLIVEGVETREQVDWVTKLGGRFAQGFFYCQALPFAKLQTLLDLEAGDMERAA